MHIIEYYPALKKNEYLIHDMAWINFEDIFLSEKNWTNIVWFHLDEVTELCKLIEAEGRLKLNRGGGVEKKWGVISLRVSVYNDEKVLEMKSDDSLTNMWMYLVLLNYIVRND